MFSELEQSFCLSYLVKCNNYCSCAHFSNKFPFSQNKSSVQISNAKIDTNICDKSSQGQIRNKQAESISYTLSLPQTLVEQITTFTSNFGTNCQFQQLYCNAECVKVKLDITDCNSMCGNWSFIVFWCIHMIH